MFEVMDNVPDVLEDAVKALTDFANCILESAGGKPLKCAVHAAKEAAEGCWLGRGECRFTIDQDPESEEPCFGIEASWSREEVIEFLNEDGELGNAQIAATASAEVSLTSSVNLDILFGKKPQISIIM